MLARRSSINSNNQSPLISETSKESNGSGPVLNRDEFSSPKQEPQRTRKLSEQESHARRQAKNRAAQRAFRERKETYTKSLEAKIAELEDLQLKSNEEKEDLAVQIRQLEQHNNKLKQAISILENKLNKASNDPFQTNGFMNSLDTLTSPGSTSISDNPNLNLDGFIETYDNSRRNYDMIMEPKMSTGDLFNTNQVDMSLFNSLPTTTMNFTPLNQYPSYQNALLEPLFQPDANNSTNYFNPQVKSPTDIMNPFRAPPTYEELMELNQYLQELRQKYSSESFSIDELQTALKKKELCDSIQTFLNTYLKPI